MHSRARAMSTIFPCRPFIRQDGGALSAWHSFPARCGAQLHTSVMITAVDVGTLCVPLGLSLVYPKGLRLVFAGGPTSANNSSCRTALRYTLQRLRIVHVAQSLEEQQHGFQRLPLPARIVPCQVFLKLAVSQGKRKYSSVSTTRHDTQRRGKQK